MSNTPRFPCEGWQTGFLGCRNAIGSGQTLRASNPSCEQKGGGDAKIREELCCTALESCWKARTDGFSRHFGFGSCGNAVLPLADCLLAGPYLLFHSGYDFLVDARGCGRWGGRKRHLLSLQEARKSCRLKAGC